MSSRAHIERPLKTHGWEKESPNNPLPCKEGETDGHLHAPPPADCLTRMFKEEGPKEGTVEHAIPEKKEGFECHVHLGELMHAVIAGRPDACHAVTTMSKFSGFLAEHHCKLLKGIV